MSAIVLDGRRLARETLVWLAEEAGRLTMERGRRPRLELVMAGDDPTAALYAQQVERSCRFAGVSCAVTRFGEAVEEGTLRDTVAALGEREDVEGVVALAPLPAHIRQWVVMEALAPEKDVDGLGPRNAGRLMLGFPGYVPSTADAALEVLRFHGVELRGKNVVVVGRSAIGGKAAALLFLREDATVTLCHSRTPDLGAMTRQAEIIFTSVGRPGSITGEMVQPGAIVLDAGMNMAHGTVVGDVDFSQAREVAGYLSPAPGGLGPLTHVMLIRHTLLGPR